MLAKLLPQAPSGVTSAMQYSPRRHPADLAGNLVHQQRLAESLLHSMSYCEAVQWCQEYGWEGVLRILLAKRSVLSRGARGRPHR